MDAEMINFTAALVQTDIIWHDIQANIKHAEELIASVNSGISLIALPEMFSTGFTMHPEIFAEDMDSQTVEAMKKMSCSTVSDVAGSIIIRENNRYFNRLIWASPDNKIRYYDKRHLFRPANENDVYTAGTSNIIIERDGWRIMPFICYDLRFPVCTRNTMLQYDILLFLANWPCLRQNHWEILLRARAIENQCYVVGVNRSGKDGNGIEYKGGSVVFDFKGDVIVRAGEHEQIVECSLEYSPLLEYRSSLPFWMDADKFYIC